MYCTNCNHGNPDNAVFCENCGMKLGFAVEPTPQPTYGAAPSPQPTYAPAPENVYYQPTNGIPDAVKRACRSGSFLTAVICVTIAQLLAFFSNIVMSGSAAKILEASFSEIANMGVIPDVDEFINTFSDAMSAGSVISAISSLIPAALMLLGLWMIYAAGRSRTESFNTAGFTIIEVISIISLVILSIVAVVFVILMIVLLASIGAATSSTELLPGADEMALAQIITAVLGVCTFIVAVIFTLIIIFYAKIVKSLGTVKKTALTGIPSDKVSSFVGVFCIIFGIFSGISALGSFSLMVIIPSLSLLSFFSSAAMAVAYICFGVTLFSYRDTMRRLTTMTQQNQYAYYPDYMMGQ